MGVAFAATPIGVMSCSNSTSPSKQREQQPNVR